MIEERRRLKAFGVSRHRRQFKLKKEEIKNSMFCVLHRLAKSRERVIKAVVVGAGSREALYRAMKERMKGSCRQQLATDSIDPAAPLVVDALNFSLGQSR